MLAWRKFLAPPPSKSRIVETIIEFLSQKKVIAPNHLPGISDDTHFINDLGMESLDVVEMIIHLERRFHIAFDQATHIPCLNTVKALCDFTKALIQKESFLRQNKRVYLG